MFLRSNPDFRHGKNIGHSNCSIKKKVCCRAENRSADISLKQHLPDEGKNSKFLSLVFSNITWKPRIALFSRKKLQFVKYLVYTSGRLKAGWRVTLVNLILTVHSVVSRYAITAIRLFGVHAGAAIYAWTRNTRVHRLKKKSINLSINRWIKKSSKQRSKQSVKLCSPWTKLCLLKYNVTSKLWFRCTSNPK